MGYNKRKDSLKQFGERVKALREAANLSQEQVHYATGISQPYIVRIEKGETNIGLRYISLLGNFFGLDDHELLNYDKALPPINILKENIFVFLKNNNIEPTIFFKKGLVRYLEITIATTKFFNSPKYTKEIIDYLYTTHEVTFSSPSVSQAMDGFRKKGLIDKLPTDKKSKYQYRKK